MRLPDLSPSLRPTSSRAAASKPHVNEQVKRPFEMCGFCLHPAPGTYRIHTRTTSQLLFGLRQDQPEF